MAMKGGALCFWLLGASGFGACRSHSLCENAAECALAEPGAESAGTPSTPAPNDSGGAGAGGSESSSPGGQAGEASIPEAGSDAGGGGNEEPLCRPGTAECDGSTFTPCETPTTFSFRNCGSCGMRCEGSCISGSCKPAETLLGGGVESFVADSSRGFALVSGSDDTAKLYRFDLDSGAAEPIADDLESNGTLVLGAGQLFVSYSSRVVRMALDGTGLATETFEPETFGATKDGAYYTTSDYDPDAMPSERGRLWFRAADKSSFELLLQGAECRILASARTSLLVEREGANAEDAAELLLIRGREVSLLGPSPQEPRSLSALTDGAALLLDNAQAASGVELLWLRLNEDPRHFAVESDLDATQATLVPAPGGVALVLEEHGNTFVRLFSSTGADAPALGISNYSALAYVDPHYLWYSHFGTDGSQRFLRSRQFELSDAIPTE